MMTEQKIAAGRDAQDSISFAALPENIVVIRISGRGSFHNSMELRRLADAMISSNPHIQFIIDMEECITMDSTFMGVLASMGLKELKATGNKLTVVNANSQNVRLLQTLGLSQFIVVRESHADAAAISDEDFQCMIKEDVSRTDRIVHMIEAHQYLCEADPSNNIKFESVLKYLHDSLENKDQEPGHR